MSKGFLSKLFPKATLPARESAGKSGTVVSSSAEVDQFLATLSSLPASAHAGRLVFALDATASRQATWDSASQLQAQMFSEASTLGGLALQLCYFRGFGDFYASGFQRDAADVLRTMQGLRCEAGRTQIEAVLRHALAENARSALSGVVYIGDCLEEELDPLADLAAKLGMMRVPLFAFQEGSDAIARAGFEELARLSGGAFSRFDSSSADQLRSLLRAVAAYAAGGRQALQALGKRDHAARAAVALLERQIRG